MRHYLPPQLQLSWHTWAFTHPSYPEPFIHQICYGCAVVLAATSKTENVNQLTVNVRLFVVLLLLFCPNSVSHLSFDILPDVIFFLLEAHIHTHVIFSWLLVINAGLPYLSAIHRLRLCRQLLSDSNLPLVDLNNLIYLSSTHIYNIGNMVIEHQILNNWLLT